MTIRPTSTLLGLRALISRLQQQITKNADRLDDLERYPPSSTDDMTAAYLRLTLAQANTVNLGVVTELQSAMWEFTESWRTPTRSLGEASYVESNLGRSVDSRSCVDSRSSVNSRSYVDSTRSIESRSSFDSERSLNADCSAEEVIEVVKAIKTPKHVRWADVGPVPECE